jgi:hypothetical protein
MPYTERFSEVHDVLGRINPASYTSEQNTGYVHMQNYHRAAIVIHAGVLGQNVDIDIEQAQNTAGLNAKTFDAGSKDILLTATTDNNTVSIIEIKSSEFDVNGAFDCLNVEATPVTSAAIFGLIIYGTETRFAPVPTTNVDTITD